MPLLIKYRITCLGVALRARARKPFVPLLTTLLDGQHIRQFFSVALEIVETVARAQVYLLGGDTFPMFLVGWTW